MITVDKLPAKWKAWSLPAKERLRDELKALAIQRGLISDDRVELVPPDRREEFVRYQGDPVGYSRDVLGIDPWAGRSVPGQLELFEDIGASVRAQLDGLPTPKVFRVEAGHGVGKCVAASEWITLACGGRATAGELIGQSFDVLTLVDGKPKRVRASAEFNAVEPVYEMVTETGKTIVRNAEHPIWSAKAHFSDGRHPRIETQGFVPVSEIHAGDLVAVAEELPAFGDADLAIPEIRLLAYLLGEGGYTSDFVTFTQADGVVLDEFRADAQYLGCRVEYRDRYDYRICGPVGAGKGGNPVLNLLRRHGMMGAHSRDKRVPAAIFRASKEGARLFLNRIFATDGWACVSRNTARGKSDQREIGFCSASRGLIEDIVYLLQKFGIHARITRKPNVQAWTLTIKDAREQIRFCEEIGIFGKERQVSEVESLARPVAERRNRAESIRKDRPAWERKNAVPGTRWERVKSVTQLPPQATVAISVPVHHTFLTQFYEHNTFGAAVIVNWWFDAFPPSGIAGSTVYTTAPTSQQVTDLLWADIKTMRPAHLPGRVLPADPKMIKATNWWAVGRTTTDSGGKGTARVQGKHSEFALFVLDEAEGVPDYVFTAIWAMMTGSRVVIVLMLANPQTRTSRFHKAGREPGVKSYRLSVLDHPNVVDGCQVVPGATTREWVIESIQKWCQVADIHNDDNLTFTVPYDVPAPDQGEGAFGAAGTIFQPSAEFMFRVMGVAPLSTADDTFIPVGRYEAACKRKPDGSDSERARLGIDAAGYGNDLGTLYVRHAGAVWRAATMSKKDGDQDPTDYWQKTRKAALDLKAKGVKSLHIRIDAGGGFGNGVYDRLKRDQELVEAFEDYRLVMVHFGGEPYDPKAYRNTATELYAEAAESIKGVAILRPPEALEGDLCERKYHWVNFAGKDVRIIEDKDDFKRRMAAQGVRRSPDDGDGFCLAICPDHIFNRIDTPRYSPRMAAAVGWGAK